MCDTEPLFLVHDEEPQIAELYVLREQAMCTDDDVDLSFGEIGEYLLLLGARTKTADQLGPHREACESLSDRLHVLESQDRRGRQQGDLFAVHDRLERGTHRHFGLAVPDIPAQQPIHRSLRFHIAFDVGDRSLLIGGQFVFEGLLELLLPVGVGAEGVPLNRLPRRVKLQQLLRHVAHRAPDARLGPLPRRPTKPIERRLSSAGVLLHAFEPFDRHVQLVLTGVPELDELMHVLPDDDLLESCEDPDAVVDVYDRIADLQIAKIGQKRSRDRAPAFMRSALLVEDVGLGVELQRRIREAEAARELASRYHNGAWPCLLAALDKRGWQLVVHRQLDDPLGAPRRRGNDHGGIAPFERTACVRHPVAKSAPEFHRRLAGDMTRSAAVDSFECQFVQPDDTLELLLDRLPGQGQRVRFRDALGIRRSVTIAGGQDLAQLARLCRDLVALGREHEGLLPPHDVVEDRGRTVRGGIERTVGIRLEQLPKRDHAGAIESHDRALGRRIVAAYGLDGVTKKLDPDWPLVVSRKKIDQAPPHAVLTVFVDRILPRKPRVGEPLRKRDRAKVAAGLQVN